MEVYSKAVLYSNYSIEDLEEALAFKKAELEKKKSWPREFNVGLWVSRDSLPEFELEVDKVLGDVREKNWPVILEEMAEGIILNYLVHEDGSYTLIGCTDGETQLVCADD